MRRFFGPTGSVSRITVESRALENNLLGDPSLRIVDIYLPAGHDGEGLPLLVDLVGFTGSGLSHTNWVGFRSIAGGEPNGTRSRAAFLRVSPADELIALWPRTSVSAEIFALAAHLAERMNYFGRAESLGCARAEHDVDREARTNCRPGSEAADGSVSVEVLAPLSPQAYAAERARFMALITDRPKSKKALVEATLPASLFQAIQVETAALQAGASRRRGISWFIIARRSRRGRLRTALARHRRPRRQALRDWCWRGGRSRA